MTKHYMQNKMNCELMLTYNTPALRQTGSRNMTFEINHAEFNFVKKVSMKNKTDTKSTSEIKLNN
jgi:hypothetical protein